MAPAGGDQALAGPLARTVVELVNIERAASFRRRHREHSRDRLGYADSLMTLIEECRLRNFTLLPPGLWIETVRFLGTVDSRLRDELGIDRHPDHVADVVFEAQQRLMDLCLQRPQPPRLAPIIPLFPGT